MIFAFVVLMLSLSLFPQTAGAVTVSATAPYSVTVFAPSFASQSGADSIAFNRANIFVGYAGGVAKDGSDHKPSTIVEYDLQGKQVQTFSVVGHSDGLRIDPQGNLWALQNEDGNPNLAIINTKNGKTTNYTFAASPHGGGYDDIVFAGSAVFITASNPSKATNTDPAVVSAKLKGKGVALTAVLKGNASATDIITGTPATLNLQDPDSMILDPDSELLFTSQADKELIIIEHPGLSCQNALVVPLTTTQPTNDTPMADDTVFARSAHGQVLFADKTTNIIYSMTAPYFAPGAAYTAYQDSTATNGFVGQVNLSRALPTCSSSTISASARRISLRAVSSTPKPERLPSGRFTASVRLFAPRNPRPAAI